MKIKNVVILIFMVISLGLFPAKIYRSNKNRVSKGKSHIIK